MRWWMRLPLGSDWKRISQHDRWSSPDRESCLGYLRCLKGIRPHQAATGSRRRSRSLRLVDASRCRGSWRGASCGQHRTGIQEFENKQVHGCGKPVRHAAQGRVCCACGGAPDPRRTPRLSLAGRALARLRNPEDRQLNSLVDSCRSAGWCCYVQHDRSFAAPSAGLLLDGKIRTPLVKMMAQDGGNFAAP